MFEVASGLTGIGWGTLYCLPSILAQSGPDTFAKGELVSLVSVACLFGGPVVVGIVWIVGHSWSKATMHAGDLELKHRLLDAGMTADEIECVINAGRNAKPESEKS